MVKQKLKLITVDRAKEEIKRLRHYVKLVESYEANTLDKQIIKEYAITCSIEKVVSKLNIEREYVTEVLKRRGSDELHKIVRSGYMQRTKGTRKSHSSTPFQNYYSYIREDTDSE